jgi:hypothetical protein
MSVMAPRWLTPWDITLYDAESRQFGGFEEALRSGNADWKPNPRYPKGYTSSPNWRIRPLSNPSGDADSRERD